ncbi:MAG TPA: HlyD family efflux transporter periplasmic adaptor subunit [Longimicrobiales bacterium]
MDTTAGTSRIADAERATANGKPDSAVTPVPPSADGRRRNWKKLRKRTLWLAAAALAAVLGVWLMWPEPLEVDTGVVTRGPLETTVDAEGITRVRDRYEITTPVAGRIDRTPLRVGDPVRVGMVLARITPMPLDPQAYALARANVAAALAGEAEAAARVGQAQRTLEQAERSTARLRVVADAGALSREDMEQAELELAAARSEHRSAVARATAMSAEVRAARSALLGVAPAIEGSVTPVRSPVAGTVLSVHEPDERVVAAGTPLLAVADALHLEVVVDVLSTDAVTIEPGAVMRLVEWGGSGSLEAHVRTIEPQAFTKISALGVEEQRVQIIGELLSPPAAIGDAYRVEARIVTWSGAGVVKVPNSALFTQDSAWNVLVVEDGRARVRQVRAGHRGAAETEILAGLAEGETVIRFPTDRITPGDRVKSADR